MRLVVEAVIALSPSLNGFTASDVAARVGAVGNHRLSRYGPRHAAYDRIPRIRSQGEPQSQQSPLPPQAVAIQLHRTRVILPTSADGLAVHPRSAGP